MTTFFSCDVETTSTSPLTGHLLTLGIQPVVFNENLIVEKHPKTLYVRIDQYDSLDEAAIDGMWGDPDNDASSFGWWAKQNDAAQDEAWRDRKLVRHDMFTAAGMVSEFVRDIEPDRSKRIFVANPVSFDKPWFEQLFWLCDMEDPFHYQSLCLRSMKFGLRAKTPWTAARDNHEPRIPHHALWDADAQADDLIAMLAERDAS